MKIGSIDFPIYGLIVLLSTFIGMLYVFIHLKKEKKSSLLLYICLYFIFSFFCGKIFTEVSSGFKYTMINAPLSSYGGFVGVILASFIFQKIEYSNKDLIKYSIISLPLVYGLSKIACFISGCCYGIPFNSFFSVTYTSGLNIKLFPIQIVETIVFLIIFLICNKYKKYKYISYITIIISALAKLLLDFLRYEHLTKIITINQYFSLGLIIVVTIILSIKYYKDNKSK